MEHQTRVLKNHQGQEPLSPAKERPIALNVKYRSQQQWRVG